MAVGIIGAKHLSLTAMNVRRRVLTPVHRHQIARRLNVRHMPFDRHAMRVRLEAAMAVDLFDGAGPRFWRVRALRHVAQHLWVAVIERLMDVLAGARGIVLNMPVTDWEREAALWRQARPARPDW